MIEQLIRTPFTDLVGVPHPVVQTGMGWVSGPRLVSATAKAGGLGILASATMTFGPVDAPREVSVEELLDLEQQADFFIALGQEDAAVEVLVAKCALALVQTGLKRLVVAGGVGVQQRQVALSWARWASGCSCEQTLVSRSIRLPRLLCECVSPTQMLRRPQAWEAR